MQSQNVKLDTKTLSKLRRRVRDRNRAFQKLSKPQQRVQIARDVLAQLAIKKIVPRHAYFEVDRAVHDKVDVVVERHINDDTLEPCKVDFSAVTSQVQCEVCGIGALFVATVERANNLKIADSDNWSDPGLGNIGSSEIHKYLKPYFSEAQLIEIEDAFEENIDPWANIDDDEERMTLIMENIIHNNGTFKSNKRASAAEVKAFARIEKENQ